MWNTIKQSLESIAQKCIKEKNKICNLQVEVHGAVPLPEQTAAQQSSLRVGSPTRARQRRAGTSQACRATLGNLLRFKVN